MHMKRTVGEKGQVVLPKYIRDSVGIKPGSAVTFDVREGEIVIKPQMSGKKFVEYFCKTSRKLRKPLGIKEIKKILDQQYEEEYGLH